jgi:hypothetical protein
MTISTEAASQAFALALAMTWRLRARQDRSDFGGEDSHLVKVRCIGRDYPCVDDVRDGDFGFYLGRHDGDYFVAVQANFPPATIGCERFQTQEELKAHWELE